MCTHCRGGVITTWSGSSPEHFDSLNTHLEACHPTVGEWQPRVKLSLITNEKVRADFQEAIDCYNNELYNACMVMSRRAIQQEMIPKEAKGDSLYQKIESTGISKNLKKLLQKVKNFGNHGAHPDFCLYDENGELIKDKKKLAKLSLEFLDRYFADAYETASLVQDAPKSKKELET